jgi:hypothetical protein
MSWLTNWDEAAKRPRRTVMAMCSMGAAGGFAVGYLEGHSVGFAVALAVGFAVILGFLGWRTVNNPARLAELRQRRRDPWRGMRRASLRIAIPLSGLLIATFMGVASGSLNVFVGAVAVSVVVGVILSRSMRG